MRKRENLSKQLRSRVAHGYYALRPLSSERQLAAECGVSYMTARRAIQELIQDGLIRRGANGRLEINRSQNHDTPFLSVALLRPASRAHHTDIYGVSLNRVMAAHAGSIRSVEYVDWDDPLIANVLQGFDGAFVIPNSEPVPPVLVERFQNSERPVVVLGMDLSHQGIPSITNIPPASIQLLLNHLEAAGCKRIACLNIQPHDNEIQERINQWRVWIVTHRYPEFLIDYPAAPYSSAFIQAYQHIWKLLKSGEFAADSLLCTTTSAAMGAMRALHEAGIWPGLDVAVCAMDGEDIGQFCIPSLTAIVEPDPTQYIRFCVERMIAGGGAWKGPLQMQPVNVSLALRESTLLFRKKS